jgi:K+-transporting ATPase KdpF subunit
METALILLGTGGLTTGYIIGAVIALLILLYLIYALVRPEKL